MHLIFSIHIGAYIAAALHSFPGLCRATLSMDIVLLISEPDALAGGDSMRSPLPVHCSAPFPQQ